MLVVGVPEHFRATRGKILDFGSLDTAFARENDQKIDVTPLFDQISVQTGGNAY